MFSVMCSHYGPQKLGTGRFLSSYMLIDMYKQKDFVEAQALIGKLTKLKKASMGK